ncbi:MAG: hypothetical protein EPO28_06545 [Saprospiraceae bacterium]|nr:MAG: hypothetical protein EPO28_06545 [Saprospiraceae bacterium]
MNSATTNPLAQLDWDDVLDTLDNQKCVLFLGAGAYAAPGGGSIENALCQWLKAGQSDHPHIRMYNPDGFFLFRKSRFKRKVIADIGEFYSQPFPETEAQFARIARTPFSMIFTLTPDNILARTFDSLGYDYQPDFYFHHRKAAEKFERPSKKKPLIYNLLGNIEEPESLLLTHTDFFDYLESVFIGNSMNPELKDELERAERYIFLGLPYEKWYFQLLLRVLSLHSDKLKEVERLALKEFENPHLNELFAEEFKIQFYPGNTELFVNELFRHCEEKGLLKPLPTPGPAEAALPDLSAAELKNLAGEAETGRAMLHLKVMLDRRKPRSHRLANDLVVLRNQFNLLRQRELRGTIDSRDLAVENNQITERLLELITQTETLKP